MASPTMDGFDRPSSPPHLVSLVLQSKKGLQHGEQLCSRAHDVTYSSARQAVDVLALDAKIRWITEGVLDQLIMAAGVAKSIAEQRARLEEEAKQWDRIRAQHQDALDATLESLGAQLVPPSFHQSSLESSLFGIQPSDDNQGHPEGSGSPTGLDSDEEGDQRQEKSQDRSKWKTLRDFVDERGIEDVLESIEEERNALDETLSATATYPATITSMITHIRTLLSSSLPEPPTTAQNRKSPIRMTSPVLERLLPADKPQIKDMSALLGLQERISAGMASHLESLAAHYDQMATALKEKEAGEELAEEDMEVFIRDTAELPSIISELEESIASIERVFQEISETKSILRTSLATQSRVIDSLDLLGDRMDSMLKEQNSIEMETQGTYETLNDYLDTLLTLRSTYETYQLSYNALVLEMDRRARYRDYTETVVQEMRERLEKIRNDEITAREAFYSAHSASIPDDLCLAISNLPQTILISSALPPEDDLGRMGGSGKEVLPEVDDDLLLEARRRVDAAQARAQDVENALVTPVRPRPRREDSL